MMSQQAKQWLRKWPPIVLVVAYVVAALAIDLLAPKGEWLGVDWSVFERHYNNGFDLYKFVAWFAIPFVLSLPWMDWGYFGVKRWKRADLLLLLGLALMGLVAVLAIPLFPFLRDYYQGYGHRSPDFKWAFAVHNLWWIFSWLLGWEFMHRYFLLKNLQTLWARYAWLLAPLLEGAYHLTKPTWMLEAPGMVLLSLIMTYWAMKRRNVLLPFLAHLMIELELVVFVLLY